MRFIYADPALCLDVGHHASTCRSVMAELIQRRIPARVLAFTTDVDARLRSELGVLPFFRYNSYWSSDGDPIAGTASAFHDGAQTTREDLHRIGDLNADDIVFFPWAGPAQFHGAVLWLKDMAPERMPFVAVNFLHVPEMNFVGTGENMQLEAPDYRVEPRAVFLRFAAKGLTPVVASRLAVSYLNPEGVTLLKALMGIPIEQLPSPQHAMTTPRARKAKPQLTIGMLGHQRGYAKGLYFMPVLVQGLLATTDAQCIIHNGARERDPEVEAALRRIAASTPRLTLVDGHLDATEWALLLDRIDLIVCPYSREEYRLAGSGILNEAIANGIPSVVPSSTTLESTAAAFGGASVIFGAGEPQSILEATRVALSQFDRYAEAAQRGTVQWREANSPKNLIDRLITLAQRPRFRSA